MVGRHRLRRAASVFYFCALAGAVVFLGVASDGIFYRVPEADTSKTYLEFDSMEAETGMGESENCSNYDFCKSVVIYESDKCANQVDIIFNWFDINDQWITGSSNVINSPDSAGMALVEVGLDSVSEADVSAFEYFEVFQVSCTIDQLTGQAKL